MGEGVREMPTLLNKIPKFYRIELLKRGRGYSNLCLNHILQFLQLTMLCIENHLCNEKNKKIYTNVEGIRNGLEK